MDLKILVVAIFLIHQGCSKPLYGELYNELEDDGDPYLGWRVETAFLDRKADQQVNSVESPHWMNAEPSAKIEGYLIRNGVTNTPGSEVFTDPVILTAEPNTDPVILTAEPNTDHPAIPTIHMTMPTTENPTIPEIKTTYIPTTPSETTIVENTTTEIYTTITTTVSQYTSPSSVASVNSAPINAMEWLSSYVFVGILGCLLAAGGLIILYMTYKRDMVKTSIAMNFSGSSKA